jgi:hypothetical protein
MKKKSILKPVDEKAREAAIAVHLGRYAGNEIVRSANHEGDLPAEFNLKLGPEVVGTVKIDWTSAIRVIMDIMVARKVGSEMSDEEYIAHVRLLESIFAGPSPDLERQEKLLHWLLHMVAHLPDKLNRSIALLSVEAERDADIAEGKKLSLRDIPSSGSLANWVAKIEREAVMRRLPETRGGSRRTKPQWQSKIALRIYAMHVDERLSVAERIKRIYRHCDGAPGWTEDLNRDKTFQKLRQGVPDRIIRWATKYVADQGISSRNKSALIVACEIARRELELPKQTPKRLPRTTALAMTC